MKASILVVLIALLIPIVAANISSSLFDSFNDPTVANFGKSRVGNREDPSALDNFSNQNLGKSRVGKSEASPIHGVTAFAEFLVPPETTQTEEPVQAQLEEVSELAASTLAYIGGTMIPLASYQTTIGKYLWIGGNKGLSQYASIPQYSSLSLMAYTSTGGPGEILEIYPSESGQGIYQRTDCSFDPGYTRIPYLGDVPGRHYVLFSISDETSNAVIIDVEYTGSSAIALGIDSSAVPIAPGVSGVSEQIDQLNPQPKPLGQIGA